MFWSPPSTAGMMGWKAPRDSGNRVEASLTHNPQEAVGFVFDVLEMSLHPIIG